MLMAYIPIPQLNFVNGGNLIMLALTLAVIRSAIGAGGVTHELNSRDKAAPGSPLYPQTKCT